MAVLEARKLKKMDITGASDPYVKLKLFDSKVCRDALITKDFDKRAVKMAAAGIENTRSKNLILCGRFWLTIYFATIKNKI